MGRRSKKRIVGARYIARGPKGYARIDGLPGRNLNAEEVMKYGSEYLEDTGYYEILWEREEPKEKIDGASFSRTEEVEEAPASAGDDSGDEGLS